MKVKKETGVRLIEESFLPEANQNKLKLFEKPEDLVQAITAEFRANGNLALIIKETSGITKNANTLEVISQTSLVMAADAMAQIKTRIKFATELIDEPKKKINIVKDGILAFKHEILDPLEAAHEILDKKQSEFHLIQRQKQKEEQDKIDRVAAIAEEKRIKELEDQAVRAREKGQDAKADALEDQAEMYHEPSIQIEKQPTLTESKSGKLSSNFDFTVEITNPLQVIQQIANGTLQAINAVEINPTKMKAALKATVPKDDWEYINKPGIRIIPKFRGTVYKK